jgi:tetratricopeptide (TPR) repeat protein
MERLQLRGSGYALRDVATLVGLTQAQIRSYVRLGILAPVEAPGGAIFSFQDLILLKTAKALIDARIPGRRIHAALKNLRAQLPAERPLSGVRIAAHGNSLVVRDGAEMWNPESGQALLDFEVDVLARAAAPLALAPEPREPQEPRREEPAAAPTSAAGWFRAGVDGERDGESEGAERAYREALALAPGLAEAHLNLGRLLHERGAVEEAEGHFRQVLEARADLAPDPAVRATAAFNLGVVLQDRDLSAAAIEAYEAALALDPTLADAHYNLAIVHESLGQTATALRHLKSYRALTSSS